MSRQGHAVRGRRTLFRENVEQNENGVAVSGESGSAVLKSLQKSPIVLLHSSSAALTVNVRFTCPASLR